MNLFRQPLMQIVCGLSMLVGCADTTGIKAERQDVKVAPCETYRISGPAVIAFFDDEGSRNSPNTEDALDDFRFFLQGLRGQIEQSVVRVHECYQPPFDVEIDGQRRRFAEKGVGYYLLLPGKAPRLERGVVTDDDLIVIMRDYFGPSIVEKALRQPRVRAQSSGSVDQLRSTGTTVAKAVLNREIETILLYDRPDLRKVDRSALEDHKSDLYCFLFDRSCNVDARLSVRDVLGSARNLAIEVQLLPSPDAPTHALLLFFDTAVVDRRKLQSASYQCELSRRHQLVSWLFKRENDSWISAHPPFDAGTDTLCSP